ncbi:MAG: rhodanese-like domain-containing protein [Desulfuromonadaceae bacterium]
MSERGTAMPAWILLLRYTALVTLTLLPVCTTSVLAAGWQMVSPQRLAALLKEGSSAWVVDVRNTAAFAERHIEGAVNIPLSNIPVKTVPRQKTIVLVDDTLGVHGAREAADILVKKGHEKVLVLEGGLIGWKIEGYQISSRSSHVVVPPVMPEELAWARKNGVPIKIYDLRDKIDCQQYPVQDSLNLGGKTVAERLQQLKELLINQQRLTLSRKLEKVTSVVLVLPMAGEVKKQVENIIFDIPVDVRYLDGGYAAWMVQPERKTVTDLNGPICNATRSEGGTK